MPITCSQGRFARPQTCLHARCGRIAGITGFGKYELHADGVLQSTSTDFAGRRDYESYKRDGVANVKLIFETGRLGKIPAKKHIENALRYLDSHLTR